MAIVADLSGNFPISLPGGIDKTMEGPDTSLRPDTIGQTTVAFGTASASSGPFGDTVHTLRITPNQNCFYRVGATVPLTAVVTDARLPLGVVEYIDINPGDRIAVIRDTVDGTLHVTPMNKRTA